MAIQCPFCRAENVSLISLFGSQLLLSQYRCEDCRTYFEGLRDDRSDAEPSASTPATTTNKGDQDAR